jgi:hypothetical protein
MTPLASYLAKQIAARPKHREHAWSNPENLAELRKSLDDVRCFEVTACLPLLIEVKKAAASSTHALDAMCKDHVFLPSPRTWIEWIGEKNGNRIALRLEEGKDEDGKDTIWVTAFCAQTASVVGEILTNSALCRTHDGKTLFTDEEANELLSAAVTALVLINSPRIIGQEKHKPGYGLRKHLSQSTETKSFKLQEWTEIKLQVTKPRDIDDGEPHTDQLTGKRALHFCRKHIRIRLGKLEYVSAHWRGDPAIGIRQSRYVVTP